MEEQDLDDLLGCKKEQPTEQHRKTGKKYIYTKKYLSAFSVFIRVLLIIIWGSTMLSFLSKNYLAFQMIITTLIYGFFVSIFWFTLGNILLYQRN